MVRRVNPGRFVRIAVAYARSKRSLLFVNTSPSGCDETGPASVPDDLGRHCGRRMGGNVILAPPLSERIAHSRNGSLEKSDFAYTCN